MCTDSTDLIASSTGATWSGSNPQHRRALVTAKAHPNFLEASKYVYWAADVFEMQKDVVYNDKNLDVEETARLTKALFDVEKAILIFVATSDKQPQPLCGGGKSYHFIFHPQTLELLHTSTGTWRS